MHSFVHNSDWKIYYRNATNIEVVNESDTIISGTTAQKTFTMKVLGNGSIEIVFQYGSRCPYGTEEVVVKSFIVEGLDSTNVSTEPIETPEIQKM